MSGSWEGSSEECVPLFLFPFYRQRGTAAVYDRFGNEIFSQIPSGDTPITVDSEEIKVVHFEIWLLLAHWLSNRLVGWNTHGKENDQKNSVTICHRYVSQPSIYMIKCWGSFIRPPLALGTWYYQYRLCEVCSQHSQVSPPSSTPWNWHGNREVSHK